MRISDWSSDVCSSDLTLELPAEAFDLAYSSLAFHYVRDFGRLARVIRQALARGGRLVFTIEHPVFMAAAQPRWISDGQGRQTWPVNQYALEGERRTDWYARSEEHTSELQSLMRN